MRLLFDIWIKNLGKDFKYSPEEKIIFKEIYNYVYDRVYLLLPEIDKEQDANERTVFMVYLLEKPMKIQPSGFSDRLFDKIMSCFNENDPHLLWERVEKELVRFLN